MTQSSGLSNCALGTMHHLSFKTKRREFTSILSHSALNWHYLATPDSLEVELLQLNLLQ